MGNWSLDATPRESITASEAGAKAAPAWATLQQHLREVGTLRSSLYRLARASAPAIVLCVYWFLRHPGLMFQGPAWWYIPRISILEVAMLLVVTLLARAASARRTLPRRELLHQELAASFLAAFLSAAAIYPCLLVKMDRPEALAVDAGFFLAVSFVSILVFAVACFIGWVSIDTFVPRRDVLIVGTGPGGQSAFDEMIESPVYNVVGALDHEFIGNSAMRSSYLGGLDQLETILKENPISVVYCTLPVRSMYESTQQVIETCERFGVEVRHSSHIFQTRIARLEHDHADGGSILRMVRVDWTRYVKRAIDIFGSLGLLLATLPLFVAAAIAIKLTSRGPIFFSQDRYGLHRRRFRIFKMRTMVVNAEILQAQLEHKNELGGPVFKIKEDPRITKVGAFLRKTSIDELPQLWNVLMGDMSLVGPRPLAVRDVLKIENSAQLRRFSVLPGITCIWQMSGRNNTDFDNWIRQDLDYIDRWSLLLDIKILLGTVPAVLWGKGAM
jgi:exopolysaccharide biosynthesis polyprenyl glycosylphosphotransferase